MRDLIDTVEAQWDGSLVPQNWSFGVLNSAAARRSPGKVLNPRGALAIDGRAVVRHVCRVSTPEIWCGRLARYQYIEELIVDRRVLEVGCANGEGARFLAERFSGFGACNKPGRELLHAFTAGLPPAPSERAAVWRA